VIINFIFEKLHCHLPQTLSSKPGNSKILANMSPYSPFSSSDEVSDEDNHLERRHWWERAPEEPPRRRGRRTAADSDTPDESDGHFVHNPDPDEVKRISNLSDADVERYFAKAAQREAAAEARKQQRAAARKQAELAERAERNAWVEAKLAKKAAAAPRKARKTK
jgi:hypothetical protein